MGEGLVKGCISGGKAETCVFDDLEYQISDCHIADGLRREGRGKNACIHWQPTTEKGE